TGGTLDKLEAIPGFRVRLSLAEFDAALRKVGCALIGQTSEIAPADKKLYALRDVTATVESIPLITASIMSKKVAAGIDALVLDVKCGHGAFMKQPGDARRLAESLVANGRANGVRTEALISDMDVPLGRAVGNALEVAECIEVLKGNGPADLTELSITLASRMLVVGGVAGSADDARTRIKDALSSGRGLEKFRDIIVEQGGDPRVLDDPGRLPQAPHRFHFHAEHSGFVTEVHAELVGRATMLLGAGRDRIEDRIDPGVGAIVCAGPGERVRAGDALAELHYRDAERVRPALELLRQAWTIGEAPAARRPLILETLTP